MVKAVAPVERIDAKSRFLLTCEHASERMPPGYAWPEEDARLRGTHWAFDLGAAELTRELASELDAKAVLSCFSRLLIDPNRPEDSDTLFRDTAEGAPVSLNRGLSEKERVRRLDELYRPYHRAVGAAFEDTRFAFSVHSFTPVYEGEPRSLEVGVLFDADEEPARQLKDAISAAGFTCELNQPYSGKLGLMYCIDHHSRVHGVPALELEFRQDLAVDPSARARLIAAMAPLFRRWS